METFSMDENGNIRRDLISAEELCAWADAYQKAFFFLVMIQSATY
jgi:hypothetical protein